jgi:hypothetical protein
VTAAGFRFLISSNPEKNEDFFFFHLATIATNTTEINLTLLDFVIAMCLLLNRLWDPTHDSR